MTAAVAIFPVSGSITHVIDACEISATGLTVNDATAFDASKYPTEPAVTYYFKLASTGHQTLKSPVFAPDPAGKGVWPGSVIIPDAATWTLTCNKVSDDSAAATASVVVA